jgi:hypothetical protein
MSVTTFSAIFAFLSTTACGSSDAPSGDGSAPDGGGAGGSAGAGGGAGGRAADAGSGGASPAAAPYTIQLFDAVRISSKSEKENFQRATAQVDFKNGPFEKVTLLADLGTTCFPFEEWSSVPEGHNFPPDCDAYDRLYELYLDPWTQDGDDPGIELIRAVTPFGGPLHLEADITDIANTRQGVHELGAYISTWSDAEGQVSGSDGGWNVSITIDVVPGTPPRNVLAVEPLFYADHNGPNKDGAELSFSVPPGTKNARIEYRATGHGSAVEPYAVGNCIQPGDEFCGREHVLYLDGNEFDRFTPWRNDCDEGCTLVEHSSGRFEYCAENPTGHPQSVPAPRANWCPGSITPPRVLEPGGLTAEGDHTFQWKISHVADGGTWRLSALLFAYGE